MKIDARKNVMHISETFADPRLLYNMHNKYGRLQEGYLYYRKHLHTNKPHIRS